MISFLDGTLNLFYGRKNKITMEKLAVVVPYRDREEHLEKFIPHMEKTLSDEGISFKILISYRIYYIILNKFYLFLAI